MFYSHLRPSEMNMLKEQPAFSSLVMKVASMDTEKASKFSKVQLKNFAINAKTTLVNK